LLADVLLEGIPHTSLCLRDYHIKPIVDQRHEQGGFTAVDDDYEHIIQQVLAHDILIFATPLYWYGMSGLMKNFVDRWSQSLRDQKLDFKAKMAKKQAFVLIVGGDRVYIKALPLVQQFQYIFEFMGMHMLGYLIGQGVKPGEIKNDQLALQSATSWREKLKGLQANTSSS
jgi:multimeric flavodoxin WrbA